jgi:hypothetical protein
LLLLLLRARGHATAIKSMVLLLMLQYRGQLRLSILLHPQLWHACGTTVAEHSFTHVM